MKNPYVFIIEGNISKFYFEKSNIQFNNFMDSLENFKEYTKEKDPEYVRNNEADYIITERSIRRLNSSFENEVPMMIKSLKKLGIVKNIYIVLPTITLRDSLKRFLNIFEYKEIYYEYDSYKDEDVINSFEDLKAHINGQNVPLKKIHENLISYDKENRVKIMLLYGPSGVGKTESIKQIANNIYGKDKLRRIQLSMLNDSVGIDYVFGNNKYEKSLMEDLNTRKSNFILFDEFDKCPPHLYNVFYQMFDESLFKDNHFEVDLHGCTIFCTSNFKDISEIQSRLGNAIFNRIDLFIEYNMINNVLKEEILISYYKKVMQKKSTKYTISSFEQQKILEILQAENLESLSVRGINKLVDQTINRFIFNEMLNAKETER
ncbi:AAA family ATPase [Mammaliicoccus sciuri]|uniref:AAA family ATPase n=1 Tax=Mammaliicoccus sciuri TaxID=1296 RepID=UPI001FB2BB06|nr:AAA family ATPase [Mammaliicoccus sciuri]MCJ0941329.1 AAA family ATPase [Mammaliicoccus sciuri]